MWNFGAGTVSVTTSNDSTNSTWTVWVSDSTSGSTTVTWTAWQTYALASSITAKEATEAGVRAEELLASVLNDQQRAELSREHAFTVVSRNGRQYRVHRGHTGNVYRLSAEGRPVEKYCIHPSEYSVPDADVMAAQKLLLETDEDAFCRIANRTPLAA